MVATVTRRFIQPAGHLNVVAHLRKNCLDIFMFEPPKLSITILFTQIMNCIALNQISANSLIHAEVLCLFISIFESLTLCTIVHTLNNLA